MFVIVFAVAIVGITFECRDWIWGLRRAERKLDDDDFFDKEEELEEGRREEDWLLFRAGLLLFEFRLYDFRDEVTESFELFDLLPLLPSVAVRDFRLLRLAVFSTVAKSR